MLSSVREEAEGKLQMLLSPRKNDLTSSSKEVRVFKVFLENKLLAIAPITMEIVIAAPFLHPWCTQQGNSAEILIT